MAKTKSEKNWVVFVCLSLVLVSACKEKTANEKSKEVPAHTEPKSKTESQTTESAADFEMQLWQAGTDFYARGNEPSWALDMDFDKQFRFYTMDGFEFLTPTVTGAKAQDANVTRFFSETESGTLIVTIQEKKCQDSMADKEFDFSVRVQVKSSQQDDFEEFTGCGNYVPDYGLHDIWVLERLNGKPQKKDHRARLEFFVKKREVLGNSGCNDFKGSFEFVGQNEIQFKNFIITEKICTDMQIENIMLKSLFQNRMKYSIESLKLNLTGYDETEFIFKKVD